MKSSKDIAAAYDSPAWWYDARGFLILTFAYNSTLGAQVRFFGRNVGGRHLEVACGTGTLLQMVLRWRRWKGLPASAVTGVDYAEAMLEGARRRFRGTSGVAVQHADAAAMPFEDQSFDTANIANAVHCLPDVDAALRETRRVLKPGGTVAANVLLFPRGPWPLRPIAARINRWGMRKGILVTPYEREQIVDRFVAAGFEIRGVRVGGNCCEILAAVPDAPPSISRA